MGRTWIRWTCLPLVLAVFLGISEADVAAGAPTERVVGSLRPDALKDGLGSVVCISPARCVAIGAQTVGTKVGSIAATTSDGGRTWSSTPIIPGGNGLSSLACPTARICVAVGERGKGYQGDAIRSSDGGRTWTLDPPLPKSFGYLRSISCPTRKYCIAVGTSVDQNIATATALVTNDSGRTWSRKILPSGEEELFSVTCTSRRDCVADGTLEASIGNPTVGFLNSIIVTSDGGSTWRQSSLPVGTSPVMGFPRFGDVTCVGRTHCLIVGDATPPDGNPSGFIIESTDGGRTWSYDVVPPSTNILNAVTCVTASECVVAGGGIEPRGNSVQDLLSTSDGGGTWTSHSVPLSVFLSGISCPTMSSCIAVGSGLSARNPTIEPGAVVVTHDGGGTWTSQS